MLKRDETPISDLSTREKLNRLLPMVGHHPLVHIIGYLSVLGLWAGIYWVVMQATGWHVNAGASTAAGGASRRHAAALATLCIGVYIGYIWYKGVGNPYINLILPAIIPYVMPFLFPELIYMTQDWSQVTHLYSYEGFGEYTRYRGGSHLVTPFFAGAIGIFIGLWPFYKESEQERDERIKKHWREEWYEYVNGSD